MISDRNMIGAMFCAMNSIMGGDLSASALASSLGLFMGRDEGRRVVHVAGHDGDLLDDLGDALQRQQDEADEQQRFGRPQDQPAGIGRHLADAVGQRDIGHEVEDHQHDEGHQEEDMPEQVDPVLHAARPHAVDDVDADVLVLAQRVGGGEQEGGAEQIPLQLEPGVRRHVEGLADHGIDGADEDRDEDQPRNPLADEFIDAIDDSG